MAEGSEFVSSVEALRRAFDHMAAELRAELAEHEQHVSDAHARLAHVLILRAALDVAAVPESNS